MAESVIDFDIESAGGAVTDSEIIAPIETTASNDIVQAKSNAEPFGNVVNSEGSNDVVQAVSSQGSATIIQVIFTSGANSEVQAYDRNGPWIDPRAPTFKTIDLLTPKDTIELVGAA